MRTGPRAESAAPRRLRYDELLRGGRSGVGWAFLGLAVVIATFLVAQVVLTAGFAGVYHLMGLSSSQIQDRLTADTVTPGALAFLNLNLAVLIPAACLAVWVAHGLRPGWTMSVLGRIRWRWLGVTFLTAFLALAATLFISSLLPDQGDQETYRSGLHAFTATTRGYVLVIVFLTPLQAAGEEFGFRGYLMQAIGRLFAWWPRGAAYVAVLVSATLFALAHGAGQGWPVFLDRFAFGIVAAILVILTGGLEAGIAMHVLNNFLAFGLALAFGSMQTALHASGGSWWAIVATLTQSFVFLGLTLFAARRMGITNLTAPVPDTELSAPAARV